MLALRVSKKDPHEGHDHAKPKKEKRVKGLWHVKIEQQQDFDPMMHYVWLYEGPQWKTKIWAAVVVLAVFTLVLFPLWPRFMRQGVWYLSWGGMGLIGLFFAMAIFRLILFLITFFAFPPGLWLYPNLFEDVGFFDSFKPLWGWHETKEDVKRKKQEKKAKRAQKLLPPSDEKEAPAAISSETIMPANGSANSTGMESGAASALAKRHAAPTVEEVEDE